jgi:hypothetical protein
MMFMIRSDSSRYLGISGGTKIPFGQSFFAVRLGMAERTPKTRAFRTITLLDRGEKSIHVHVKDNTVFQGRGIHEARVGLIVRICTVV